MTLDEWDEKLPNGFHDAKILSVAIDYVAGVATFRLELLVGWPGDPEPERQRYQDAEMIVTGLSFCSIDPSDPRYPFLVDGRPINVGGDPAKSDHLPALSELLTKCPAGTWCYRFFVHDWNSFIHIGALDAQVSWIGPPPKHVADMK